MNETPPSAAPAGTAASAVNAAAAPPATTALQTCLTVYVKRNSHLTVDASPEPVSKGRTITVTGKVTRANWETRKYAAYGGRLVSLQFKPAGSASYTTVKNVYANGSGVVRTTVKASKTGMWRWVYYGNTTTGPSMSPGDNVVVK